MSFYECVFIMRQDIPAQDVHKAIDSLMQTEGLNSELIKKEYWGLRSFAFPIKKNKKGHYVMLGLKADPASISELDRLLKINEDTLLHLFTKRDSISAAPSPMMSAPSDSKPNVQ